MTDQKEAGAGAKSPREERRLAVGVKTAAGMLSVSTSKLWEMLRRSELPRVRVGGRTVVRISDLEAFLNHSATPGG
jgi:excisionase family DNA binding protein